MIIKIKPHKRAIFKRILNYLIHDKGRLFDKAGKSFAITHNLKGNTIEEWEKQYIENEKFRTRRRKDSIYLTHEIISWHRDDAENITLEKLEHLATEYLKRRNPKGLFLVVPHFDKDHYHLHVCASALEYKSGTSLRLSKPQLLKLKKEFQEYQLQKFPELSKSTVEHGKKDKSVQSDREYWFKKRTGRETDKSLLIGMLKTHYKKSDSKEMFFQQLKDGGIKTYERGGKITGVIFNNQKFRFNRLGFTDDRLQYLDKSLNRKKDLRSLRGQKERRFEKNVIEKENINFHGI